MEKYKFNQQPLWTSQNFVNFRQHLMSDCDI